MLLKAAEYVCVIRQVNERRACVNCKTGGSYIGADGEPVRLGR